MTVSRRRLLQSAGIAAAVSSLPRAALGQAYPSRPIRWLVGFAPGGATDILARLVGQWLTERLGQSVVIENRPGGGSNIATEAVVNAPADGYTILLTSPAALVNATLYDKLNFNFIRDIAPTASISREPNVMVVNPSVPTNSVPEFIAYAKANAGKLNMGSSGNGTAVHVAGELFKMMTGVSMQHVPYRGAAPAITDLLSGQLQVMFATGPSSIEYIKAGKLRALGVTTAARTPALPDIPTVGDFVTGYEASSLYGVGAPRNTPVAIIERLNREINAGLADPRMKARLAELGGTVLPGSPTDFATLIAAETEKWAKVVKFSGARPD
jgi:tripartite-type tricarboxylate transporter receptor subunit TctC